MKKGFTVIELIVSFSLVMVIVIFLFQIVIGLRNLYVNSGLKTELLNIQSLLSKEINKKMANNNLVSVLKCGSYCLNFVYSNGESDKLQIDYNKNTLQFGNYKAILPNNSYLGNANVSYAFAGTFLEDVDNTMILISIPIYSENFKDENFEIKVVYQYNSNLNEIYLTDFSADSNEYGYLQLKGGYDIEISKNKEYAETGYMVVNADGEEITNGTVTVNNPLSSLSLPYPEGTYEIEYLLAFDGQVVHKTYRNVNVINLDVEFDYTGDYQIFTAKKTGQYKLEVWGAEGGYRSSTYGIGGKGGYSYGTINLKEGENLYIYVGGQGKSASSSTSYVAGGYNGGGSAKYYGGTGGGATDIRFLNNSDPLNADSLASRVIVAGGGGGAQGRGSSSYKGNGGVGGGTTGGNGTYYNGRSTQYYGKGGTQTTGGETYSGTTSYMGTAGTFGLGGNGGYRSTTYYGTGGGGGGWYGGGGGYYRYAGGGGGSGFVWTSETASNVPTNYSVDTKYYLTDAETLAGNVSFIQPNGTTATGHSGNGYAKISYLG